MTGKPLESIEGFSKGFLVGGELEKEISLFPVGCGFTIGDEKDLLAVAFVEGEYLLRQIKGLFHVGVRVGIIPGKKGDL